MCCSCCTAVISVASGLVGLVIGIVVGVEFNEPISGLMEKITH